MKYYLYIFLDIVLVIFWIGIILAPSLVSLDCIFNVKQHEKIYQQIEVNSIQKYPSREFPKSVTIEYCNNRGKELPLGRFDYDKVGYNYTKYFVVTKKDDQYYIIFDEKKHSSDNYIVDNSSYPIKIISFNVKNIDEFSGNKFSFCIDMYSSSIYVMYVFFFMISLGIGIFFIKEILRKILDDIKDSVKEIKNNNIYIDKI